MDGGALHCHLHPTGSGASRHGEQVSEPSLKSKENPLLAEGREQGEYEYLQKWTVALCIVIFTPPEVGPRVTGARSLTLCLYNPKRISFLRKVETKVNLRHPSKTPGPVLTVRKWVFVS
jgi:hypothetical protein